MELASSAGRVLQCSFMVGIRSLTLRSSVKRLLTKLSKKCKVIQKSFAAQLQGRTISRQVDRPRRAREQGNCYRWIRACSQTTFAVLSDDSCWILTCNESLGMTARN